MDINLTPVSSMQGSPDQNQTAARISGNDGDLNFARLYGRAVDKNEEDSPDQSLTDIFKAAGKKYGVDYKLLMAVGKEESNFTADAVSGAGAVGIMQLMPSTARSLGVNPYNPKENIYGAAKLISGYLKQYDGDVSLALAAYGAGPGAVEKYGGVPPYGETTRAIRKILHYYKNGVNAPCKAESTGSTASELSVSSRHAGKSSRGPVNGDIINPYYGMSASEALHDMLLDRQLNSIESTDIYLTSNTDEDLSETAQSSVTASSASTAASGILKGAANSLSGSDSASSSTPGYSDFADAYLNLLGSTKTDSDDSGSDSYDPSNISLNSNIFNV